MASVLDKAAKRNLIHPNKAANIKSKTAKAIAAIG
ncbi:MAG: 30S ribosomal protein S20 [bacterium]